MAKSLKVNAFFNILSTIVNILLLFILTPVITRGLGDVGYGVYIILGTIGGALSILNLGLGEATLRYVSFYYSKDDKKSVNRVFNATFWLYAILGFIVSIVFIITPGSIITLLNLEFLGEDGNLLIRITILLFFINFINGCFSSVPQALQRYDIYSYVQIGINVVRFITNICVIFVGYGLKELVFVNGIIGIGSLLLNITVAKLLLPYLSILRIPKKSDYKEIFSYGVYAFFTQLIGLVWQYCDNILLSIFLGPQFVGYFSIPMQLIGKINGVLSSGFGILFPKFSATDKKREITGLYVSSTQMSLYLSILIFVPFSLVVDDFLYLWVSPEFAEKAAGIAIVLGFSYIIRGAFLPYESLLKGIGKPQYITLVTMLSSLVILISDITMIPLYGLNGVGIAYVFSSSVGVIVLLIIWNKIIKEKIIKAFKIYFIPYFVGVLVFFLMIYLKNIYPISDLNWINFIIEGVLIFIFNGLIMLFTIYFIDKSFINSMLSLIKMK